MWEMCRIPCRISKFRISKFPTIPMLNPTHPGQNPTPKPHPSPVTHHNANVERYSSSVCPGQCAPARRSGQPCPPVIRKSGFAHAPGWLRGATAASAPAIAAVVGQLSWWSPVKHQSLHPSTTHSGGRAPPHSPAPHAGGRHQGRIRYSSYGLQGTPWDSCDSGNLRNFRNLRET